MMRLTPRSTRTDTLFPDTTLCRSVGPQVDIARPVACVDVADAVPLVAEAAAGLCQHRPRRDLDRQLAPLGLHHLACRTDPVAQADVAEALEVRCDRGEREELDLAAAAVPQRGERELEIGRASCRERVCQYV